MYPRRVVIHNYLACDAKYHVKVFDENGRIFRELDLEAASEREARRKAEGVEPSGADYYVERITTLSVRKLEFPIEE